MGLTQEQEVRKMGEAIKVDVMTGRRMKEEKGRGVIMEEVGSKRSEQRDGSVKGGRR